MIKTPKEAYLHAYRNGLDFPRDWNITRNFTWNEVFKNEVNKDEVPILEVFTNALKIGQFLQGIREDFDKPIIVHCWVRQRPHNIKVGGGTLSAHLNGLAVDFHVDGITPEQTRKVILAKKSNVRVEAGTVSWVHIDFSNYVEHYRPGLFYV